MKRYTELHKIHQECENERYKISHKVFKPDFRIMFDSEYRGQVEGDIVTTLFDKEKKETVMSDSVMEKRTNLSFVNSAKGDVLIGGLGLGMIILAIQDNPEVKSITVVEIDEQLRDLVMLGLKDKLNSKVEIIISDIKEYQTDKKFDTIYFDIWNKVTDSNFQDMYELKAKFLRNTSDENNISSWRAIDVAYMSEEDERMAILTDEEVEILEEIEYEERYC